MFDQEKTENATPRRLQQAREKGQIAKSQELIGALLLLVGFLFLQIQGKDLAQTLLDFSVTHYQENVWITATPDMVYEYLFQTSCHFLKSLIPFFATLILMMIGGSLIQTGWLWLPDRIAPDFSRIAIQGGWGRLFSMEGLVRTVLAFSRMILCVIALGLFLYLRWNEILLSGALDFWSIVRVIFRFVFQIGICLSTVLLLFSIVDLLWQHWKLAQDLRMTPEEIKEEMKEVLGDPQILQRRRQHQQEIRKS